MTIRQSNPSAQPSTCHVSRDVSCDASRHVSCDASRHLLRHLSRRKLVLGGLAASITLPLAGCGGGAELFVPFFVFTFDGTTQGARLSFLLNPDAASRCTHSGRFGSSSVTVTEGINSTLLQVAGSFSGGSMSLSITDPPAVLAATYTGRFVNDSTVVLTPTDPAAAQPTATTPITLTRTGARDSSCPAAG